MTALPVPVTEIVAPSYYDHSAANQSGAKTHDEGVRVLRCRVPLANGYEIVGYISDAKPGKVFVDAIQFARSPYGYPTQLNAYFNMAWGGKIEDVDAFLSAEVLTPQSYTKVIEKSIYQYSGGWGGGGHVPTKVVDSYNDGYDYNRRQYQAGTPYQWIKVRITLEDGTTSEVEFRMMRPDSGEIDLSINPFPTVSVTLNFFGTAVTWDRDIRYYHDFNATLRNYTCKQGNDALWMAWLKYRTAKKTVDLEGAKAIENRKDVKPVLEKLQKEEPLLGLFFLWLHDGKVRDKTSNNKLIAAMLEKVGTDYDALKAELRKVLDGAKDTEARHEYNGDDRGTPISRNICLSLMGAGERVAEGKAKLQWQFAKGARAQAETLGISAERHPKLMAGIENGDVSLNLFHESGGEDKLINVEFDLIERGLSRPGWAEPLFEIFGSASRRTTYSKRVTSYIAFLFKIEKYLDRTATRPPRPPLRKGGRLNVQNWKAMPKFVSSQWELEMDEATKEGTTKRRSAMTPIADNDAGTITVPYVAMAVSGVRTTWCYSEVYFVAEEGAEDPIFPRGGVYEADYVEKLNGRDDYGLCYFTLTGTSRNQGYPTFLIIFERTTEHGTRVHFHRVHPSRSRGPNGTDTPPNRLTEECYRYMAGNIRAEEIKHQQGDLLLVVAEGPGKTTEEPVIVRGFENHEFVSNDPNYPVKLVKATGKSRGNLLGWLHAPAGMRWPHPEHEPIEGIAPGWYELRRCKSWEANPTSVWVLNID